MLRRHALPLLLIASALPLAACSKSEPANGAAIDNSGVANDEILANDEGPVDGNVALGNDAVLDNATAAEATNAS